MTVNSASLIWTVLVFLGFIFSVCLHEFGHAVVAYLGGDHSVKDKGYLTLNPLRYTHPTYSIVLPLVFLLLGGLPLPGAAVYINTGALRNRGWRSAVSAAGPLATFGVAVGAAIVLQILSPDYGLIQREFLTNNIALTDVSVRSWIIQGLVLLLILEVAGVILNLIPVPGLDGFGIIEPWLPKTTQQQVRKYSRYGVLALFAAFWVIPQFNQGFWSLVYMGVQNLGVPPEISPLGFYLFRQNAQLLFFVLLVGLIIVNQWKKRRLPPAQRSTEEPIALLEQKLSQINSQLAFSRDSKLLADKGVVLVQLQRYEEAIASLDQSLALDNNQAEVWAMKGYVSLMLHRETEAIAPLQRSLELNVDNATCWQALGAAYVATTQYEEALAAYDQALHYAPNPHDYADALIYKSRPYFFLGRYEESLDLLEKVLATHPDQATAWYNKACCYAQLGRLEQGIDSLKQALSRGNEDLQRQAQGDEDLKPLRSHPKFASLVLINNP